MGPLLLWQYANRAIQLIPERIRTIRMAPLPSKPQVAAIGSGKKIAPRLEAQCLRCRAKAVLAALAV